MLGKHASQITGSQIEQFILPTDIFHFQNLLCSANGGRIVITLISDGQTEIPVSLSLSPLPDSEERRIVCGIVTDLRQLRQSTKDLADAGVRLADQIAVRERAEALLHQAQKMEVVGQLTGGLAHDFNNLLMIIGGNLDLIRKRVTDDKIVQRLDQVLGAVQRGGKLTQQLLAFSRTQSLSPQSICINNLLTEVEMLIRRAVGSSIEVRFDLAARPLVLSCRPESIGVGRSQLGDQRARCDAHRRHRLDNNAERFAWTLTLSPSLGRSRLADMRPSR